MFNFGAFAGGLAGLERQAEISDYEHEETVKETGYV